MDADQWVVTVASIAAAVFAGIAALQGREQRQRELERDDTDWDVPLMAGPEVIVRLKEGPPVSDVKVRVGWKDGDVTVRRGEMRPGDDELRIETPGWTPPPPGTPRYWVENDVAVNIDWRTPSGTSRDDKFFTGYDSG